MIGVNGDVVSGVGHFSKRIKKYPEVFKYATGEYLFPGTINIKISIEIPIVEHFRVKGILIDEPVQDLIFEIVRINEIMGYRIRPFNLLTGKGGHGDSIVEIACGSYIPDVNSGQRASIFFFR